MLACVVGVKVDGYEPPLRVPKQRPGSGGEILKARADADHEIGRHAELVGAVGAGHARRAEVKRMRRSERALAGLGFDERDVVALGEGGQHVFGFASTAPRRLK